MTAEQAEPKLKLHELTDLALDIEYRLNIIADMEDADTRADALKEALGLITGDIREKATALGALVLNREADAKALEAQGDILRDRAQAIYKRVQAIQNGADGLRDYIAGNLAELGPDTQKLNGTVAVTLSKLSADKLHVTDAAALPLDCRIDVLTMPAVKVPVDLMRYTTDYKANKDALAKDGVDEAPPPGTEMRAPKRRMLIR